MSQIPHKPAGESVTFLRTSRQRTTQTQCHSNILNLKGKIILQSLTCIQCLSYGSGFKKTKTSFSNNPSLTKMQFVQINAPNHSPEINFHLFCGLLNCIPLTTCPFPHRHIHSASSLPVDSHKISSNFLHQASACPRHTASVQTLSKKILNLHKK